MAKSSGFKLIANNKKAYFDFFIDDKFECGIALAGTEVKSMRMGKCSIKESFVRITNDEVMIYGMHISPYEKGNIFNKDPLRERKLLMHRYEINKLKGKIQEKGYTLVPLQVYFKGSLVKVEIGLARGKKLYDKRADIAKKDQRRELEKEFKVKNLYRADLYCGPLTIWASDGKICVTREQYQYRIRGRLDFEHCQKRTHRKNVCDPLRIGRCEKLRRECQ